MNNPAETFIAAQQAQLQAIESTMGKALTSVEKLVELNMVASKAAVGESFSHAKAVLAVKSPQELMNLQTAFLQPMAEKSIAYFQHVQNIATEGSADLTRPLEAALADAQKAFSASLDQMAKNAPAGTEAAVAAFQNAVSQSQKAVEQAQVAIQKATTQAQANFAAASRQATDMAKKATKV